MARWEKRPSKELPIDVFQEAPSGVELDLKNIVFYQINRIALLAIRHKELMYDSIFVLETILIPYHDDKYHDAVKETNKNLQDAYNDKKKTERTVFRAEHKTALIKFRELIKLADRNNFYPERELIDEA